MDVKEACSTVKVSSKSTLRASANGTRTVLDALSPVAAPFAARWDAEADRRHKLRTPENLKKLMDAQKSHTSARSTAATAKSQRTAAKKASKNPLAATRRAARTADKASQQHRATAKGQLKVARREYPATLRQVAVKAHAAHAAPAGLASWLLSTPVDWATWPVSLSTSLIAGHAAALWIGRRTVTTAVADDGLSVEERQLMERLDPSYWVEHAADRGLAGTVTAPPHITTAGIECPVRLDGQWTLKKLKAAGDSVRALLGARTELPMLIVPATRGGWALVRLRTRSAAPDGAIPWEPGAAFGVDMTTGEDVRIGLGHRMLIAGMSGSGKSTASRPLLADASEGPINVLIVIDRKRVEGRLWDHRARVAYSPEEIVDVVQELVDELEERQEMLPKGQATLVPTMQRPRITVVVDEGAEVIGSCQKVEVVTDYTESGKPITEKVDALEGLDTIARMGRATCIDLWWMTQSPTYGDGVPRQIAKQLGTRIGLAVESPSEARVVFGESAQDKGWKADELPMPGVAMVRNGKRGPEEVKVRYMDDAQVIALPDQRIWRRNAVQSDPPTPGPLRLVKDDQAAAEVPTPREAAPTGNRQRVLQAVRDGARTGRDVTDATGINKGTVSKTVKQLVDAGEVRRSADGTLTAAAGEVSA